MLPAKLVWHRAGFAAGQGRGGVNPDKAVDLRDGIHIALMSNDLWT
jgi:hypothetical protein